MGPELPPGAPEKLVPLLIARATPAGPPELFPTILMVWLPPVTVTLLVAELVNVSVEDATLTPSRYTVPLLSNAV
jgi:hypothetical protein